MTIFYKLYNKLYVNITNACSCNCIFCIRLGGEKVGDAESLWLEHEPDFDEIKSAFSAYVKEHGAAQAHTKTLQGIDEIVFCGYGEPMERADMVIKACELIKSECSLPVRVNTNGLVKLIDPGFDLRRLSIFDSMSVSLNADDEEEYMRITNPRFGAGSYKAVLEFAADAKKYTDVSFTVVDILTPQRIEKCREKAALMGIPLRVRHYVRDNVNYV